MHPAIRTVTYTVFALLAFAGNSVLCRLALGDAAIDAASFTTLRFLSGAGALLLISAGSRGTDTGRINGDWTSAVVLFLYAAPFAFAYTWLPAGTGALILFGAVQVTMMFAALRSGARPGSRHWTGLAAALAGLLYLVSPGLSAPPPLRSALMGAAGAFWGLYSIRGRHAAHPLHATTGNSSARCRSCSP